VLRGKLQVGQLLDTLMGVCVEQFAAQTTKNLTTKVPLPEQLVFLIEACKTLDMLQQYATKFIVQPASLLALCSKRLKHILRDYKAAVAGGALAGALAGGLVGHCALGVFSTFALGACVGAGIGVLLAIAVALVYHAVTKGDKADEPESLKQYMEKLKAANITKESLETLQRELQHFFEPLMTDTIGDQEDCPICLEKLTACHHLPEATHADTCATLNFTCKHVLCWKCGKNSAVVQCPLCEMPRRFRTTAPN
jgi:hypothetical protein